MAKLITYSDFIEGLNKIPPHLRNDQTSCFLEALIEHPELFERNHFLRRLKKKTNDAEGHSSWEKEDSDYYSNSNQERNIFWNTYKGDISVPLRNEKNIEAYHYVRSDDLELLKLSFGQFSENNTSWYQVFLYMGGENGLQMMRIINQKMKAKKLSEQIAGNYCVKLGTGGPDFEPKTVKQKPNQVRITLTGLVLVKHRTSYHLTGRK